MTKIIPIKGVIGQDVTAESLKAKLDQVTAEDTVIFDISSPGGSVISGFEIYNEIKNLKAKKKIAQINGICASIASIIMMAADEIEASEVSLLMIHKASGDGQGNSDELAQQIEVLGLIDQLLSDTYLARNQSKGAKKIDAELLTDMLSDETWLTPAQALDLGFIDRVINKAAVLKMAAEFKPKKDMNALLKLKKLLAQDGRVEILQADVDEAVTAALAGRTYSSLSEEDLSAFLAEVKALLESKVGGTLTEEEQMKVNEMLNAAVGALSESEATASVEGQIKILAKSVEDLKGMITALGATTVENGQAVENLNFEITNMKKQARTFGKKPFVNESTRLNIGDGYLNPHKNHDERIKKIQDSINQKK